MPVVLCNSMYIKFKNRQKKKNRMEVVTCGKEGDSINWVGMEGPLCAHDILFIDLVGIT